MKRVIIASMLLAVFAVSVTHGKRSAPKEVPTVTAGATEYRAPRSHMGCIEAWDKVQGKMLWRRQIYVVKYTVGLVRDVQDVFISTMELTGNALLVKNERQSEYKLDLESLQVKVVKGTLVENRK